MRRTLWMVDGDPTAPLYGNLRDAEERAHGARMCGLKAEVVEVPRRTRRTKGERR